MFHRKIIISVLFLVCSTYCMAQDSDQVDTDTTTSTDTTVKTAANAYFVANELLIPKDSIIILKKEEGFGYADTLESQLKYLQKNEPKEEAPKDNWFIDMITSPITKYILWAIAIGFIAFLLYSLLAKGLFTKRPTRAKLLSAAIKEEILTPADYDKLIKEAIINKDYRLGVRYLYLQCLQRLTDKGLVTLAANKTNYQYVQELYGKSYKNDFASLTLNYEYIWYGEFAIDELIYQRISDHFKKFNSQL
ncbi:MAG TPA: hypothetical protein VK559_02055 [Ferruginibacter sp.]|nr:hypothetical protein [Ferruginibacter sp.]